jgi:hypothetical protein
LYFKHGNTPSNTYDLSQLVCKNFGNYDISCEIVRLVDLDIKAGLDADMGGGDEWPDIENKTLQHFNLCYSGLVGYTVFSDPEQ